MIKVFLFSTFLFLLNFNFSQVEQPYPPTHLVSIPTSGTMLKGAYEYGTILTQNGGILSSLNVGFTDNFTFGVSFGFQDFIGNEKPTINKPSPEVQLKYRIFDETNIMPAVTYGIDTQGYGRYIKTREVLKERIPQEKLLFPDLVNVDSTVISIPVNRYEKKAFGLYMVLSKNWNMLGNLGGHVGISKNFIEVTDGDKDFNLFFGIDKELNRSFSLLMEYDAALNDNGDKWSYDEISFGKGKGYLNIGVRWMIAPTLMLEVDLKDISKNTSTKYTLREIKIIYSNTF